MTLVQSSVRRSRFNNDDEDSEEDFWNKQKEEERFKISELQPVVAENDVHKFTPIGEDVDEFYKVTSGAKEFSDSEDEDSREEGFRADLMGSSRPTQGTFI